MFLVFIAHLKEAQLQTIGVRNDVKRFKMRQLSLSALKKFPA